jgi:hypothetical protein
MCHGQSEYAVPRGDRRAGGSLRIRLEADDVQAPFEEGSQQGSIAAGDIEHARAWTDATEQQVRPGLDVALDRSGKRGPVAVDAGQVSGVDVSRGQLGEATRVTHEHAQRETALGRTQFGRLEQDVCYGLHAEIEYDTAKLRATCPTAVHAG